MNPWKTLNIDPTDDKKVIKKAYAILLKKFKPDEYPEEFQEIQSAYKAALAQLKWNQNQNEQAATNSAPTPEARQTVESDFLNTEDEPEKESDNDNSVVEPQESEQIPVDDDTKPVQAESIEEEEDEFILQPAKVEEDLFNNQDVIQQEHIAETLFRKMHELAFAPIKQKSNIKNWSFLQDFHQITDLRLKDEVSRTVFQKLGEYNLFQVNNNRTLLIDKKTIKYFEKIFEWSEQWELYQTLFHRDIFNINFHFIDSVENKKAKKTSILASRFSAFFKDMLLAFLASMGLAFIVNLTNIISLGNLNFYYIYFSALISLRFIMETLSKSNSTPGKKSERLIVVDNFGNICTTKQTLIRHSILILQVLFAFTAFFIFDIKVIDYGPSVVILLYGIVIINSLVYLFFRKLIHDIFAKTTVIQQLAFAKNNEE